jgi:phosphoribosylformylglycinamidine cyclo-ligase
VFSVLADLGDMKLEEAEGTWNLGIGMIAVVAPAAASSVIRVLASAGIHAWVTGIVTVGERELEAGQGWEQGAKGVNGGAVRLVGAFGS